MADKYALFTSEGVLAPGGRLIAGVHLIPDGAVKVDEAMWYRLTQENDGIWAIDGSGLISKKPMPQPTYEQQFFAATTSREQAYRAESDPLKFSADYDAHISANEPDYTEWVAKVEEIKKRFPMPVQQS